jgi:hypothetical protein
LKLFELGTKARDGIGRLVCFGCCVRNELQLCLDRHAPLLPATIVHSILLLDLASFIGEQNLVTMRQSLQRQRREYFRRYLGRLSAQEFGPVNL